MISTQPHTHVTSPQAAALREAAERRARAHRRFSVDGRTRDLVVESLLRCPDRSRPGKRS